MKTPALNFMLLTTFISASTLAQAQKSSVPTPALSADQVMSHLKVCVGPSATPARIVACDLIALKNLDSALTAMAEKIVATPPTTSSPSGIDVRKFIEASAKSFQTETETECFIEAAATEVTASVESERSIFECQIKAEMKRLQALEKLARPSSW